MNQPRAFTFVEMTVSISVGSVRTALALGMVHRTMRAESSAHTYAQTERTAARLSRQFRHDIHQAQSVSLDNRPAETSSLRLAFSDQQPITYQIEKSGEKSTVLREQQLNDERVHREIFSFPADHTIQFAELEEPPRAVVSLEYDTQLVGVPPQVKLRVEAVVGLFLRTSLGGEASP